MKYVYRLLKLLIVFVTVFSSKVSAQAIKDGKLYLNEDGSHYLKLTILNQTWIRGLDYNPGTTLNGYAKNAGTDIGIRRFRMQFYSQLTDRVFLYSQIGENNFSANSDRKFGFFLHDALGEYALDKKKLSLGAGLTAWGGLARFSSPSTGSILGVDAPLFQQSTNDLTDQFLRKLSIYAKGKLGKLDYRLTVADPMAIQKSNGYNPNLQSQSNFSSKPANKQFNGYVMYQFKDQESNLMPYAAGTYLGKKKVFNIGAGYVFQKDAMWHSGSSPTDTVSTNMVQLAADVFYDAPIARDGQAISVYGNLTHFDFGPNYIRNLGVMNPTNGNTNKEILNGSGNNYPAFGTGNVMYLQAGYKLRDNLIGQATLMPYVAIQHADYERLLDKMNFYDIGINVLLSGHMSKFTAAFQNRPVFNSLGNRINSRNGLIVQYQVFFN